MALPPPLKSLYFPPFDRPLSIFKDFFAGGQDLFQRNKGFIRDFKDIFFVAQRISTEKLTPFPPLSTPFFIFGEFFSKKRGALPRPVCLSFYFKFVSFDHGSYIMN